MKNLFCASLILLLFLAGCGSIKPSGLEKQAALRCPDPTLHVLPQDTGSRALFNASMEIKKHRLTGFLLLKRMDQESVRVVFASEIGMTWFDLSIHRSGYRKISCMASLDRKALLTILASDFRLLAGLDSVTPQHSYFQPATGRQVCSGKAGRFDIWHTFSSRGDTLSSIAARSGPADAVVVTLEQAGASIPLTLTLENPVIGLRMKLKRMKQ